MIGMRDKLQFFQNLHQSQAEEAQRQRLEDEAQKQQDVLEALQAEKAHWQARCVERQRRSTARQQQQAVAKAQYAAQQRLLAQEGACFASLQAALEAALQQALSETAILDKLARHLETATQEGRALKEIAVGERLFALCQERFQGPKISVLKPGPGFVLHFVDGSLVEETVASQSLALREALARPFVAGMEAARAGGLQ